MTKKCVLLTSPMSSANIPPRTLSGTSLEEKQVRMLWYRSPLFSQKGGSEDLFSCAHIQDSACLW